MDNRERERERGRRQRTKNMDGGALHLLDDETWLETQFREGNEGNKTNRGRCGTRKRADHLQKEW